MHDQNVTLTRDQEKALIGKMRAGSTAATRDLVDYHKDRLYAFIWRMIRNHHDAEEVCQDAFLKAFASIDSFSTQYRFSTWLFTIAYRVCLNHMRRKKPLSGDVSLESLEPPTDDDGPDNLTLASEQASELKHLIWSAVEELSPPQRAAVLLFYRNELSCQEIAEVLQLPVATVKSHLHRARAKLRTSLDDSVSEDFVQHRTHRIAAG